MKPKIIEKHNRNVLSEGRDQGIAFAFLKQSEDGKEYHSVQPFSPCKDYLHEVVFTEKHNVPTSAYGLHYKKKNNIFNENRVFLGYKVLGQKNDSHDLDKLSLEDMTKIVKDKRTTIKKCLNKVEKELGLTLSKITEGEDGYYLIEMDKNWVESTHSISLYTLLLRIARFYNDEPIFDFVKTFKDKNKSHSDAMLVNSIVNKFELILKEKRLPEQDKELTQSIIKGTGSPHNYGIVYWKGKFDD